MNSIKLFCIVADSIEAITEQNETFELNYNIEIFFPKEWTETVNLNKFSLARSFSRTLEKSYALTL